MMVINWNIVVLQEGKFYGNLKSRPENNLDDHRIAEWFWLEMITWNKCKEHRPV